MILTQQEVEHVAKLAKIAMGPEELKIYAAQLGAVLDFVGQLDELDEDLNSVSPTFQVNGLSDVTRSDIITDSEKADAVVDCFPEKQGRFLSVPSFLSKE